MDGPIVSCQYQRLMPRVTASSGVIARGATSQGVRASVMSAFATGIDLPNGGSAIESEPRGKAPNRSHSVSMLERAASR